MRGAVPERPDRLHASIAHDEFIAKLHGASVAMTTFLPCAFVLARSRTTQSRDLRVVSAHARDLAGIRR
jgi:hypothetical protein